MLVIMVLELCLYSAGVCTWRFVPVEGECVVNIQKSVFGVCAVSGKVGYCLLLEKGQMMVC